MFSGNRVQVEGGGVRFCFFGGLLPSPAVTGNVLVGNFAGVRASGLCCLDAVVDCDKLTVVENSCQGAPGGAVTVVSGSLVLRNCIAVGNQGGGICRVDGTFVSEYCDVWGNPGGDYLNCAPGPTNISCDPAFCQSTLGDFRLYETSCCQGTGSDGTDIGALGVGCFTVPDVLFYDNFSDQDDAGWVVTASGSSGFSADVGTYLGTATSPGDSARSVVGTEQPFSDFAFRVAVQRPAASPPDAAQEIFLRYVDANHYYCVRWEDSGGALYKRDGQTTALLLPFAASIPLDTWVRLVWTVVGGTLTGAVLDDSGQQPLFVYEDLISPIVSGTVGVGMVGGSGLSQVRFDDVMVSFVDSTVTTAPPGSAAAGPSGYGSSVMIVRPNPFRSTVTIEFDLARPQFVRMGLYTVDGRRIANLIDGRRAGGHQWVVWNGRDRDGRHVAGGTYFLRLIAEDAGWVRKLVYLGGR